jgi:hypothetical protein
MIIEEQVKALLNVDSMLGAFKDYRGRDQDAPILQLANFDEQQELESDRIFLIRESGTSGGDSFGQQQIVSIYLFGLPTKSDMPVVKNRADEILTYLLPHREYCNIIGVNVQSFGLPVNFTETGRPFCEIIIETMVDRGIN